MKWNHVVEVGAGDRASSRALDKDIWSCANRITLYEPNPILYDDLVKAEHVLPKRIQFSESAVAASSGYADLICLGYASHLDGAPSFLATSIEIKGRAFLYPLRHEVAVTRMAHVDQHRDIDYLILSAGGLEREILEDMVSKPKVIETKSYLHNSLQLELFEAIKGWTAKNGYVGQVVDSNQHGTFLSVHWFKS